MSLSHSWHPIVFEHFARDAYTHYSTIHSCTVAHRCGLWMLRVCSPRLVLRQCIHIPDRNSLFNLTNAKSISLAGAIISLSDIGCVPCSTINEATWRYGVPYDFSSPHYLDSRWTLNTRSNVFVRRTGIHRKKKQKRKYEWKYLLCTKSPSANKKLGTERERELVCELVI